MAKKTIDQIQVAGKKVLVRCDFNVPMKDGVISNDKRIVAALPTIKKLIADGGKVILCSHLGKPKNGPEEKFSLAPVAARLSEYLVGSDGTDGPTDAAGGYVDGDTVSALKAQGLEVFSVLQNNDAYHALKAVDGLVFTGPTGTNVNDVAVALYRAE